MIYFIPTQEAPEEDSKAAKHIKETIAMWRVRYGSLSQTQDHIDLAIMGLVPMAYLAMTAYIWLSPLQTEAPRAALREAKRAFATFEQQLPWTTFAFTEVSKTKNTKFAQFMGYAQTERADGHIFGGRE